MVYPGLATLFVSAISFVGVLLGNALAQTLLTQVPLLSGLDAQDSERILFRVALSIAGGFMGFNVGLIFFRRLTAFVSNLERVPLLEKMVVVSGVVIGLIIAFLATSPFRNVGVAGPTIQALAYLLGIFLGLGLALSARHQLAELFPAVARSGLPAGVPLHEGHVKFLDTNIIIDGRIADICKTGFLEGPNVIPGFVLEELQDIADSADTLKRARGRRGLEVLNQLKSEVACPVQVIHKYPEDLAAHDPVDLRLVKMAKYYNGAVVTNDYNLNEIAKLHEVPVLNVHELARALKPVFLPGEDLSVTIAKVGNQPGQGVGYLDDGTMVVVEEADHLVGQLVPVVVKTLHHSRAGKMIFGEVGAEETAPTSVSSSPNRRAPVP